MRVIELRSCWVRVTEPLQKALHLIFVPALQVLQFLLGKYLKVVRVVPTSSLPSRVSLDLDPLKFVADRTLWCPSTHSFCHIPIFLVVAPIV